MIVVISRTKMRADVDLEEYDQYYKRTNELVQQNPGFISATSYHDPDGGEVLIACFTSEEALEDWRMHPEHLVAQRLGRTTFFESYWIQVCTTIREYGFNWDSSVIHQKL